MRARVVNPVTNLAGPGVLGLACLLASGGKALGQQPPGGGDKPKPAETPAKAAPAPSKAAPPTLEEMIARALKDNPDIRVGEAKVREAEAELNRTRLQVTQKVIAFHKAWEGQKALVDLAEKEFKRFEDLHSESKVVAQHVLDEQRLKLASAKTKLAEIEAEMPYLLGQQQHLAIRRDLDVGMWLDAGQGNFLWSNINQPVFSNLYQPSPMEYRLDLLDPRQQYLVRPFSTLLVDSAAPAKSPLPGSVADRIRHALDTNLTINCKGCPLSQLLEDFRSKTGITFQVSQAGSPTDLAHVKLEMNLGEVPLGAALQALEDTIPQLRFTPRDYGVLVTLESRLPPGALRMHDFWKGKAAGDKAKTSAPEKEKPKP